MIVGGEVNTIVITCYYSKQSQTLTTLFRDSQSLRKTLSQIKYKSRNMKVLKGSQFDIPARQSIFEIG